MTCKNIIKSAAFGSFQCGTEIQGGIHLCSTCMMLREQEQIAAPAKRDFENLDVRLYLALKAIVKDWVPLAEDAGNRMASEDPDYKHAREVMRDFEDSFGPMPEWAIARNFGFEYVLGTQLFTRNSRRHGNAWLVKIYTQSREDLRTRENPYGEWTAYTVLTEAGNLIENVCKPELEEAFWAGDWICTLDHIAERFDHDGLLRAMGAC